MTPDQIKWKVIGWMTLMAFILTLLFGCKKEHSTSAQSGLNKQGKYIIKVNSNHKYPFFRVEHNKTGVIRYNLGYIAMPVEIMHKQDMNQGQWDIYTLANKNGIDSTKDMIDNGPLWISMVITLGKDTIFKGSDTARKQYDGVYQSCRLTIN